MRSLAFSIPQRPRAWQRARLANGQHFESADMKATKGVIQVHAIQARNKQQEPWPVDALYRVEIDALFECPASLARKGQPFQRAFRPARPDCDNLYKILADALQEGILWNDDAQIVESRVRKFTASQGEPPRTEVRVLAFTQEEARGLGRG